MDETLQQHTDYLLNQGHRWFFSQEYGAYVEVINLYSSWTIEAIYRTRTIYPGDDEPLPQTWHHSHLVHRFVPITEEEYVFQLL